MGRRLVVYLLDGEVHDVTLDGESLWPMWFKIEWKENGQRSAKIRGERLSTNHGDEIVLHAGEPATSAPRAPERVRRPRPRPSADPATATE